MYKRTGFDSRQSGKRTWVSFFQNSCLGPYYRTKEGGEGSQLNRTGAFIRIPRVETAEYDAMSKKTALLLASLLLTQEIRVCTDPCLVLIFS